MTAQPAEVSDAAVDLVGNELARKHAVYLSRETVQDLLARAILALRPQAVPMTSGWRDLRDGETFMAGDRMLCNGKHWHIVEDGSYLIGRDFDQLQHYPAQRLTSGMDHHGITAQAKEGGA